MALIGLKCPNCNGEIQMDDTKENGFCMYCGSNFHVKDEVQRIQVEHSGTVNLNRKEESENLAIIGEQKFSEKTSFTAADVKYIMDNYAEKSLILDMTNEKALALRIKLNNLTKVIQQNQAKIDQNAKQMSTILKVIVLIAFGLPIILMVSCVLYFAAHT